METYLQHQRPTDETTLINMILRKWMIFWQCHTIFRITYSYTYLHNVEIKSLILNSVSKGSKHKKVDIKSSHQRWLLTQWLSRQKEWATFVVDVIIYKVTAIQMRKFSSRYHFSLKIDLYLQNRINFDTSKLSMRTPPPPSKKKYNFNGTRNKSIPRCWNAEWLSVEFDKINSEVFNEI